MQKALALLVLFSFICACSSSVPKTSTTPTKLSAGEEIFVEKKIKIEGIEKLDDYPVVPLLKDTPSPKDGILYSPRSSAECSLSEAEADRLSVENSVILKLRTAENGLQERYTLQLEESLKKATEKTWWDVNKEWVYLTAGVIGGAALSLLIFSQAVDIKSGSE